MEDLKPYPKYKTTKLNWLNQVPIDWDIKRTAALFHEKKTLNKEYQFKQAFQFKFGEIVNKKQIGTQEELKETYQKYTIVDKDDIVINGLNLNYDFLTQRVGKVRESGIITSAYISISPQKEEIEPRYACYLLKTLDNRKMLNGMGTGIRLTLSFPELKKQYLPLPPLSEQIHIANYLDYKVALINKFIKDKKKEIILLKEQKQAEINQAVTRGVNPNAKMKDSGISWIGEIPEHWEVKRLKHFAKINPSIQEQIKKYDLNDSVVFLAMENISVDGVINNIERRQIKDVKSGYTSFAKNDVVIAKITPCFENGKGAFLSELETNIGFGTTELIVLRPNCDILGVYLYFILKSDFVIKIGADFMTGSAGQKRIPTNFIENFRIGFPTIQEQQIIVDTLNLKLARIEKAITTIENQIKLMQDYKISLISDVVTGKVDVRNIAVQNTEDEPEEDVEEMEDKEQIENSEE